MSENKKEIEYVVLNVVAHYYYYYEKHVSVFYNYKYIIGQSCLESSSDCAENICAALDLEALRSIVNPFLNPCNEANIDSCIENSIKEYLCINNRVLRPTNPNGTLDDHYSPSLIICRLLIPALFTQFYIDDIRNLDRIISALSPNQSSNDKSQILKWIEGKAIPEKSVALRMFEQCTEFMDERDRQSERELLQILQPISSDMVNNILGFNIH